MGWQGKTPSDFVKTMKADVENHTRKVVIILVKNLTLKTPVDQGRARSNWIVTSGTAFTGLNVTAIDKSGSASIGSSKTVKPVLGRVIFITNNLPYIGYLENGTVNMAPFSMVERSIQATLRQV